MIEIMHDGNLADTPNHWNAWRGILPITVQRVYLALRTEARDVTITQFSRQLVIGRTGVIKALKELEAAGMVETDEDYTYILVKEAPRCTVVVEDKNDPKQLLIAWDQFFLKYTGQLYQRTAGDEWRARHLAAYGRAVSDLLELIAFYWNKMNNDENQSFAWFCREINNIISYKAEWEKALS